MKILIFSDSHGDVETMVSVVENEKPEMIIHLGDSITDAEELHNKYTDIEMIKILGGIDSQKENEEWIQFTEICGKRFMLTHGHTFLDKALNFRQGEQQMWMYAGNANIVLYGHSHEPFINCCLGKWIMNPGRIGRSVEGGSGNPTYGVLIINESGNLQWQFKEV